MSNENKSKENLKTLSDLKSTIDVLVAKYNKLAAVEYIPTLLLTDAVDEEEDEEESWNNSGCSWVSSQRC